MENCGTWGGIDGFSRLVVFLNCANDNTAGTVLSHFHTAVEKSMASIRGKQMTPAVASERSIFSKNHDYNI